ncbi:hypothetical protein [Staphylococcus aureus]
MPTTFGGEPERMLFL